MAPTTSAAALSQLQQFQSGMKQPNDILSQQQQQLGVPQQQQNISGLRTAVDNTTKVLNNIAPSVMGRTQNSLVTSAQANNQISNQQAPVNAQLTSQNAALGNATQDYNTAEQQAESAANLQYQGENQKESYLQNIYNSLFQQEQAAAQQSFQQQQLQEQAREANLSAKTASSGASAPSFSIGDLNPPATNNTPSTPQMDPVKQQAQTAVTSLLGTGNKGLIQNTISAITKSAGYGNAYDQMKLQLLRSVAPQFFQTSNNNNNTTISPMQNMANNAAKGLSILRK